MNILQDLLHKFKNGNWILKIIYFSVFISFLFTIVGFFLFPNNKNLLFSFFSLPPDFESYLKFPFALLTYPFVSSNLFDLIFGLFAFHYLGQLFLTYFRERDVWTFLLIGTVGGGVSFLALSFLLDGNKILSGFSPILFCLLFAIIAYQPKLTIRLFFVNVSFQLQYVGYFLLFLELMFWNFNRNDLSPLANIGTSALGYFYMKQFEMGNDFVGSMLNKLKLRKKNYTKLYDSKPPRDEYEYQDYKADKQKKLNEILEKISNKGYDSLTKAEKEFLFKVSK
jgi:membrane associated rhomboid family serine protease